MLDMYIFENMEMTEQLQTLIIDSEKTGKLTEADMNEIFRIMHTIKGSSGMMMFDNIAKLAHKLEDIFFYIRESKPERIDYSRLTDLVLEGSDLIKSETEKINNDQEADSDFIVFLERADNFLSALKSLNGAEILDIKNEEVNIPNKFYISNDKSNDKSIGEINNILKCYEAELYFEENCEMENIRCFTVIHKLKEIGEVICFLPEDILENSESCEVIKENGFKVTFKSSLTENDLNDFFLQTIFLKTYVLQQIEEDECQKTESERISETFMYGKSEIVPETERENTPGSHKQNLISVDVSKLDKLMDLVGELVISEAMVSKNSDLNGLVLDNFHKATRQHRKRLTDLQDVVMSIRMVSLAPTLNKMNRIVRDMCKKLDKEVELNIIGQDTEVDKNIIEHIGDPLMHIVRNAMDHGIETTEQRIKAQKPSKGRITIEAKNTGGEVWIIIKDDGKGLDKEKIIKKARTHGLLSKNESELTEKEIYSLILLPGFSTNENVTEFSGRGVGMDVVVKEIEKVRGNIMIDSEPGQGTTISIRIPLTLAIIDGMTVKVGNSTFTIPITAIRQSYIIKKEEIIHDLDHNEMVLIRGVSYSILRLHEQFHMKTDIVNIEDGIVIMVEEEGKAKCIFADALIGEQQVVIKALPEYLKKVNGISGCTLLGDGSISLILDISEIVNL